MTAIWHNIVMLMNLSGRNFITCNHLYSIASAGHTLHDMMTFWPTSIWTHHMRQVRAIILYLYDSFQVLNWQKNSSISSAVGYSLILAQRGRTSSLNVSHLLFPEPKPWVWEMPECVVPENIHTLLPWKFFFGLSPSHPQAWNFYFPPLPRNFQWLSLGWVWILSGTAQFSLPFRKYEISPG